MALNKAAWLGVKLLEGRGATCDWRLCWCRALRESQKAFGTLAQGAIAGSQKMLRLANFFRNPSTPPYLTASTTP